MDNLDTLPEGKHEQTPEEKQTMEKVFGSEKKAPKDKVVKLIIIAATYLLLNNPFLDGMLESVKCVQDNPYVVWAIKGAIFVVILVYVTYYMK